jgi:hypothetical protein
MDARGTGGAKPLGITEQRTICQKLPKNHTQSENVCAFIHRSLAVCGKLFRRPVREEAWQPPIRTESGGHRRKPDLSEQEVAERGNEHGVGRDTAVKRSAQRGRSRGLPRIARCAKSIQNLHTDA